MKERNDIRWLPQEIRQELDDPNSLREYDQGRELIRSVMTRSTADLEFRRQLLEHPKRAVTALYEEQHGHPFPGGGELALDIRFVENEGDLSFVLPPVIDADGLSDVELEAVAGGVPLPALPGLLGGAALLTGPVCVGIFIGATIGTAIWVAT